VICDNRKLALVTSVRHILQNIHDHIRIPVEDHDVRPITHAGTPLEVRQLRSSSTGHVNSFCSPGGSVPFAPVVLEPGAVPPRFASPGGRLIPDLNSSAYHSRRGRQTLLVCFPSRRLDRACRAFSFAFPVKMLAL